MRSELVYTKGETNNIKPPQITLRKFGIDYLK